MTDKYAEQIYKSDLVSRDLSWLQFNHRVLDQAKKENRNLFEKLKFLAITASNADEFFMIRVGSLYNYIDFGNDRLDYSGLRSLTFKDRLLQGVSHFNEEQSALFIEELRPKFSDHDFELKKYDQLTDKELKAAKRYFEKTIFPMLTPMVFDQYHSFPILMNNVLIFGVVTKTQASKEKKKMTFIPLPQNLPRFFEIVERGRITFIPMEDIVRAHIQDLFKGVDILSSTLFRGYAKWRFYTRGVGGYRGKLSGGNEVKTEDQKDRPSCSFRSRK